MSFGTSSQERGAGGKALISQNTYQKLLRDIGAIYEDARRALMRAWWLIGQRIVEVDQGGEARAPHGKSLLMDLSRDLTRAHGRGFSYTNLKNMRRYYLSSSYIFY
jgi:alkylation response protein AidB-like acyl-CoA dehydrogenase